MPRNINFAIRGEYITLDALLKAVGAADSGAQAKHRIAEGEVTVDGEVETRKTRKLRGGGRKAHFTGFYGDFRLQRRFGVWRMQKTQGI